MPLETELAKLTAAVEANTEALLKVLAASGTPANVTPIKAAKPVEPEPDQTTEPEEITLPAKIEKKGPGRPKATPVVDDTPAVASNDNEPGGPVAGEHVDVDEVLAEITEIVKTKITGSTDPDKVKTAWGAVRKGFGVERVSDLKADPAKLLAALAAAKKL